MINVMIEMLDKREGLLKSCLYLQYLEEIGGCFLKLYGSIYVSQGTVFNSRYNWRSVVRLVVTTDRFTCRTIGLYAERFEIIGNRHTHAQFIFNII